MFRALLSAVIALTAFDRNAAETCCVDELFAEAFFGGAQFSRDWPANYLVKPFDADALEMIGSQLRTPSERSGAVAWLTNDPVSASTAIDRALAEQDWQSLSRPPVAAIQRGFVLANAPAMGAHQVPLRFCKNTAMAHVQQRQIPRGTVFTLHLVESGRSCDALVVEAEQQVASLSGGRSFMRLAAALPQLRLPPSIDRITPADTNQGMSTAVRAVVIPRSSVRASELTRYFDAQMNDQDWFSETHFGGGDLAGSVWRKTTNDDTFVTWLMAFDQGGDVYLRMTTLDPNTQGRSGVFATSVLQAR